MMITESDIEDAIRQKRIMTATLTRRFGVIESLDRSISQAGVEDTNLQMLYIKKWLKSWDIQTLGSLWHICLYMLTIEGR